MPLCTDGSAQTHLLTSAHEVGWFEQIKIALRNFRVTEQIINGAEARAHHKVSGFLFINVDNQILTIGNIGRFRLRIHLGEVLQTFQTAFAQFDASHIKNFTRSDG